VLLLDRYILARFFTNFIVLFALLFIFATTIDLILHLDRFIDAARDAMGDDAATTQIAVAFVRIVADFELPRLFQFYAYLHGTVGIGAMGFTLALMHKHRELVAVLASGVSLYRVAVPFFIAMTMLSAVQIANQELMLPRIAPLLLRGHGQIGEPTVRHFEVRLTPDGHGSVFQAPSFDPLTGTLSKPTIIERSERGLTTRRITAERAVWDAQQRRWVLTEGRAIRLDPLAREGGVTARVEPVEDYRTDLDPRALIVQRYGQFASMLSLAQISEMLESGAAVDERALLRHRSARFATVIVNLLVLGLTLPCFLLREPAKLLKQSVLCAALAVPAMLGSAAAMTADLPGIAPAAGAFLPVLVLAFLTAVPWTFFRT
jgi:lipopolysaccharide export system permease protein